MSLAHRRHDISDELWNKIEIYLVRKVVGEVLQETIELL